MNIVIGILVIVCFYGVTYHIVAHFASKNNPSW